MPDEFNKEEVQKLLKVLEEKTAKNEDVSEIRKDLEAMGQKIESLPEVIKSVDELKAFAETIPTSDPTGMELNWQKMEGFPGSTPYSDVGGMHTIELNWTKYRKELEWRKQINTNDATTGTGTGVVPTIFSNLEQDGFLGEYTTITAGGDQAVNIPIFSGIEFRAQANAATATNEGSALSSTQVTPVTYTATAKVAEPSVDDLPGLRQAIAGLFLQSAGLAMGNVVASVFTNDANQSNPTFNSVNTGVATGLPTDQNLLARVLEMKDDLRTPYRMAAGSKYYMHTALQSRLQRYAATNSPLEYRITEGMDRIFGKSVMVNDLLDNGGAARDCSAVYGDLRRAIIGASNETLLIRESWQNDLGFMTWFARFRFGASIWDPRAASILKSSA